jgi:uncharacterized membrane protein
VKTAATASATVLTGLLGGLYYGYAVSVMPGLAQLDDRAYATAFNHINVAIVNPVFMLSFLGAPALNVVAAAIAWRRGSRTSAAWITAAAALNVIGLGITGAINIPLNDQLAAGGSRDDFETAWVAWNIVRTLVTTGAFAALTAGLVTARKPRP